MKRKEKIGVIEHYVLFQQAKEEVTIIEKEMENCLKFYREEIKTIKMEMNQIRGKGERRWHCSK